MDPRVRPYVPNALANRLARSPVAIASSVYADRMGMAASRTGRLEVSRSRPDPATGKSNYTLFAEDSGMDVLEKPELLETPAGASMSSAWFFWRVAASPLRNPAAFSMVVKTISGAAPNDANHGQLRINRYVKTVAAISQAPIFSEEKGRLFSGLFAFRLCLFSLPDFSRRGRLFLGDRVQVASLANSGRRLTAPYHPCP